MDLNSVLSALFQSVTWWPYCFCPDHFHVDAVLWHSYSKWIDKQLPAIESVLNAMKSNTNQRVSPIFALVLCPTRELAIQLTAEANVLLKYHEGIGVQSLIGGTRFKLDQRRLESDPCQVWHIYRPTEDQYKTSFGLSIFCFLLTVPDFSCNTWQTAGLHWKQIIILCSFDEIEISCVGRSWSFARSGFSKT